MSNRMLFPVFWRNELCHGIVFLPECLIDSSRKKTKAKNYDKKLRQKNRMH